MLRCWQARHILGDHRGWPRNEGPSQPSGKERNNWWRQRVCKDRKTAHQRNGSRPQGQRPGLERMKPGLESGEMRGRQLLWTRQHPKGILQLYHLNFLNWLEVVSRKFYPMEKEFRGCEKLSTVMGSAYTVRKGGRDGTSPHCDPTPKPLVPYPPPCCQSRWGQTMEHLKKKKKQPEKVESNRKTDPLEGPDVLRCMSYVTQCLSRIV